MMSAVLSNPSHPEYGVATIPFPIPRDQYTYCMDLLEALEIGDTVKADCKVEKIDSFYTVLKRTEMLTVNGGTYEDYRQKNSVGCLHPCPGIDPAHSCFRCLHTL